MMNLGPRCSTVHIETRALQCFPVDASTSALAPASPGTQFNHPSCASCAFLDLNMCPDIGALCAPVHHRCRAKVVRSLTCSAEAYAVLTGQPSLGTRWRRSGGGGLIFPVQPELRKP